VAADATCSLCGRPAVGPTCYPGPALGIVHRSCFRAFDSRCEAEERGQVELRHTIPLPVAPARRRRSTNVEVAA
jgi:hypothetical protein